MLKARRGSMYDPLVVDAFFAIHSSIRSPRPDAGMPSRSSASVILSQPAGAAADLGRFDSISQGTDEMLALFDLARELAGTNSLSLSADVLIKHLKRFIPFSVAVLYVFDETNSELVAKYSNGDQSALTQELRIAVGQRLSGWVAANRRTIVNSDASLDFGDVAHSFLPPLKSSLSAPIVLNDKLLGVLTVYSNNVAVFSDKHRRVIDMFSEHAAIMLHRDWTTAAPTSADSLRIVTDVTEVEHLLLDAMKDERFSSSSVLLFVDIIGHLTPDETHGSPSTLDAVRHAASAIREDIRHSDVLIWRRPHTFIALLADVTIADASEDGRGNERTYNSDS